MKRISTILVVFAAVFALSAVAVGSASANVLIKVLGGEFPQSASGKNVGAVKLETVNKIKIECTETEAHATIGNEEGEAKTTTAHLFLWWVLFKGCKHTILGGGQCNSTGKGTGEIEVGNTLVHFLGHVGLAHRPPNLHVPAVLLLVTVFEFNCTILGSSSKVKVEGNVIGEVKPGIGVKTKTLELSFTQTEGKQELTLFLFPLNKHTGEQEEGQEVAKNQHLITTDAIDNKAESGQEGKVTLNTEPGIEFELEEG